MNIKNGLQVIVLLMAFSACKKEDAAPAPTTVVTNKYPNPLGPLGADPGVILINGTYYCYFTSGNSTGAMPVKWSSDLLSWTDNGSRVFPTGQFPAWVNGGSYWAPEVYLIKGKYVCYYATKAADGWFKIGAATASGPTGPFTDKGSPLASNPNFSLIDPTFYCDSASGKNYVIWKTNKNALSPPQQTELVLQEVSQDGLSLIGSSKNILVNDLTWEALVIEAPSLMYRNGYYYLFYSGNNFGTDKYAVGVARSTTIGGTYIKKGAPILVSDNRFDGPGGQTIVLNSTTAPYLLFYHARLRSNLSAARYLMMDEIKWGADNWPTVNDGTPGD